MEKAGTKRTPATVHSNDTLVGGVSAAAETSPVDSDMAHIEAILARNAALEARRRKLAARHGAAESKEADATRRRND